MNSFPSIKLILFGIIILTTAKPLVVQAETIHQIITMALQHNPTLAVAQAKVSAAEATTKVAQGAHYPSLNIRSGVQRSDAPMAVFGSLLQQRNITVADFAPNNLNNPAAVTNYHSEATLALPLYHGGALGAAVDVGEARIQMQRAQQRAVSQQIIAATITAFVAAKSSDAESVARQQEVVAARQRLHDIQQRQRQGMALDSDIMDAKAHLLQTQLAQLHSQHVRANSIDKLRQLTTNSSLTIEGDIALKEIDGAMESWVTQAIHQRADLQSLLAAHQALHHQRAVQRASWLPNVDLVASQQWNSGNFGLRNRNSTIGATLSLNLFNGGRDQANMSVIEANLAAMDGTIAQKQALITQQVQRRWRAWQEAKLQLKSALQLRKQRREALRIRQLRYQQGLESSSELLRTQVANDVAEVDTIHARYGLLQSIAMLYASVGSLTSEVIQ